MPSIAYSPHPGPAAGEELGVPSERFAELSEEAWAGLRELLGDDRGVLDATHLTGLLRLARAHRLDSALVELVRTVNGHDVCHVRRI